MLVCALVCWCAVRSAGVCWECWGVLVWVMVYVSTSSGSVWEAGLYGNGPLLTVAHKWFSCVYESLLVTGSNVFLSPFPFLLFLLPPSRQYQILRSSLTVEPPSASPNMPCFTTAHTQRKSTSDRGSGWRCSTPESGTQWTPCVCYNQK